MRIDARDAPQIAATERRWYPERMRHGRALALSYFVLVSIVLHVQGYGVVSIVARIVQRRAEDAARAEHARLAAAERSAPHEAAEIEIDFEPSAAPSPSAPSTQPEPSARPSATVATPHAPIERVDPVRERARERTRDPRVSELELLPPPVPTPPAPAPAQPPPPMPSANMQSVDQQLETREPRPDDPAFLAQSNHDVREQTIAALRGLTTPGLESQTAAAPPQATPGDGNEQRSADDRDQQGNPTQSPSEGPRPVPTPSAPQLAQADRSRGAVAGEAGLRGAPGGAAGAPLAAVALERNRVLDAVGSQSDWQSASTPGLSGAGDVSRPGQGANANGDRASAGANAGLSGTGGQGGRGLDAARRVGVAGRGATATIRTLSPTHAQYAQVFGADATRERVEAQLHRSRARGGGYAESWRQNRAAIENFTPSIRVGNQTALRTAASPFAAYLTSMHRRIHRHFADGFLAGLEGAPGNSPLNDPTLVTQLEITLERDGRIARLGVVRTSGNAAFDVAALNSVRRGAPYGAAPDAIVSGDGHVYVRWGFYRSERQCGTFNAEPYILPAAGASPPPLRPPPRARASDQSLRDVRAPRRDVAS